MLTIEALFQMAEQNHEQSEEGHHRLRTDLRGMDLKLDSITKEVSELRGKFILFAGGERSTDVSKLRWTARDVLAIVAICLSVAGGMWASTYGMRSDIRNIMTRMDSASEALKLSVSLAEERAAALKDSIDSIKRRQELQQYEIQSLKEMILKGAQR